MSNVTATTTLLDLYLEGFKTKSSTNQVIAAARAVSLGELVGKEKSEKKLLQFLLGYTIVLVNKFSNTEDTYSTVKKLQILERIKTEYIDVLNEHVDESKKKRALVMMHSYLKAETGAETLTAHIEQLLAVYGVPSKYYGFIVTVGLSTLRDLSNPLTHSKTMDQINQLRKLMNTEEEVKEETLNDEDLVKNETQQERSKFDIEEDLKSIASPIGKLLDKYNVPEKYQSLIERTIEGLLEKAVEYVIQQDKKGKFDEVKAFLPTDIQEELTELTLKLTENFKDQKEESKEDDEEKEELEDDGQPVRLLSPNERLRLQGLFAQNPHKMDDNAYLTLYTATNKDYPMLLKKYAA